MKSSRGRRPESTGWKRRKPLWPFVGALTILMALAVDAPRKWQPPREVSSLNAPRLPGPDNWYLQLYPPHDLPALPETSPVEAPRLPLYQEPQELFPMEAVNTIRIPSAAGLPQREEFTLDTLLEIRDSLQEVVGELPELPTDGQQATTHPLANDRVQVSSSADRLAMRRAFDRSSVEACPPPVDTQRRLETFADELMETVRRSRLGLKPPVRVAQRQPAPVVPVEPEPVKAAVTASLALPPVALPKIDLAKEFEALGSQVAEGLRVAARTVRDLPSIPVVREPQQPAPNQVDQTAVAGPSFEEMPVTPLERPSKGFSPAQEVYEVPTEEPRAVEPQPEPVVYETPPTMPLLRFRPQGLVERLQRVPTDSPSGKWSAEALQLVQRLADDPQTTAADAPAILAELKQLASTGQSQAEQVADYALRQHWLRLVRSLECRITIWQYLLDPQLSADLSVTQLPAADEAETLKVLKEIVDLLEGDGNGQPWREYLMLDNIAAATSTGAGADTRGRRKLSQEVLSRIEDPRLTPEQTEFVNTPPVGKLRKCLLPWAMGPVDLETLAALVERYDVRPDTRFAAALNQFKQRLQWSQVEAHQQLARHLDEHYRGANMRVAVSSDLLTRLLPQQSSQLSPVNDHIAGAPVKGRSRTTVKLLTEMIPNEDSWQIALRAKGAVFSKTHSDTWPAKVNNSAKMFYDARKTIWIDGQGMRVSPTQASVKGRNELVGIDSELDPIPVLGFLVRDAARRKHHESRGLALKQAKAKVARQAKSRMDRDANRKLSELKQKYDKSILTGLEKLALVAEPTEMFTTSERAVMRMRLANSLQLAASSLRPLAPSDSLASVQLHESVLNNALAGLQLEGRQLTALQLHHFIVSRLGRPGEMPPEDLPARATIEFAPFDAVRFNCQGDRLEVVLNIRQVAHGRDKIGSFAVHAFFRPVVDGLDVRLVREGTLQFDGRRLRYGHRAALHSVFNKLLRKDQEVQLVKHDLDSNPRLKGLMVTQLVIDDGWIGLALGPNFAGRTAWRTLPHVLR